MPLRPARILAQAVATSLPTGETIPRPVMTTRRLLTTSPYDWSKRTLCGIDRASGLALVRIDVVHCLLHGRDFFGVFIRDFRLEFFLERHHQFHRVQRVGP